MTDRSGRARLEEAQGRLKVVRAELATPRSAGFEDERTKAGEELRVARERLTQVERARGEAATALERVEGVVGELALAIQAQQAQRSPGLIAYVVTPALLVAEVVLFFLIAVGEVPAVAVMVGAPAASFLLGLLWKRRLSV